MCVWFTPASASLAVAADALTHDPFSRCLVLPQSEYVAPCDMRRPFISGFTGSAGTAVVTETDALLWTDGRYYAQAAKELPSDWVLMKDRLPDTPSVGQWLASTLPREARVGIDPTTFPIASAKRLRDELAAKGIELIPLEGENLVDRVWGDEKPARPAEPVFLHPTERAGQSVAEKVATLRDEMENVGATVLVVAALDEVMWLLNIRGGDIPHNPVAFSYATVTRDSVELFIDAAKVSDDIRSALETDGVRIHPYDAILSHLRELSEQLSESPDEPHRRVWMDPQSCNFALAQAVPEHILLEKTSPIPLAKALKNDAELRGMRDAHRRDGAAVVRMLAWVHAESRRRRERGEPPITEWDVSCNVTALRAQNPEFVTPSFPTIAGSGPNGAVIHYGPTEEACSPVDPAGMLLVDSGGQYRDGTTDITRTIHLGDPTPHQVRCFTRVLQGFIAVASAVFPQGTRGDQIDSMARMFLWREGLDFAHGTGHGVGAFLNVHEGPEGISPLTRAYRGGFRPGMTVTDEPGYYQEGDDGFGIRIENVLLVQTADTPQQFRGQQFCCFENITYAPIQHSLIDTSLLSPDEIQWLNDYHTSVRDTLLPLLNQDDDSEAREYLLRETEPLAT